VSFSARIGTPLACLLLALTSCAQAHLMPAQKGTINLQGDGAYMVVSLPVSAFEGVDDDGDGAWSAQELGLHGPLIHEQITQHLRLRDARGVLPIDSITLVPTPPDDKPSDPVTHLVVLARFKLAQTLVTDALEPAQGLIFQASLFGPQEGDRQLNMTISQGAHKQLLLLSPERPEQALFPHARSVVADFVVQGVKHIWMGWDHLLFLVVVLLGGGNWRQIFAILSAFTMGHAITLAWGLWGAVPFPAYWVEAAIAGTIVGMAAAEAWLGHRQRSLPIQWRLALVLACALVHGLGLASSLIDLGIDPAYRIWTLLGFNLGVELGQCAAAIGAALAWYLLRRFGGPGFQARIRWLGMAAAMGIGTFWMVERLALAA